VGPTAENNEKQMAYAPWATRHICVKRGKEEGARFAKQESALPAENEGPHIAV